MASPPTQETIEKAVIGKRIVAVAWVPVPDVDGLFALGSITLEDDVILKLHTNFFDTIVVAEIEESDYVDAG